ncbi:MAG: type I 3-dehydroquinate dehydratase [Clostridia bacterium]|nr:type I 3-dehydroquinate dehydratase [Clostridia bacterium]MBR6787007.1 type I 3-dehydroquinate dehydratase [Clostridia bacterium]
MAATLSVRHLTLGEGRPKIIVPIVAKTESDILLSAQKAAAHPLVDLVEWRADHYIAAPDTDAICEMLRKLRDILKEKPLLFTFRTRREGGEQAMDDTAYLALCEAAAQCGAADLIDVEMFSRQAEACVARVHAHRVSVVGSWHDFAQTPGERDLIARFQNMQDMGADVLKIAVMPKCLEDVTHLISAAKKVHASAARPLCAISMGDTGCITRTHCAHFGGCMTFGALDAASAPGQISVKALHEALQSGC